MVSVVITRSERLLVVLVLLSIVGAVLYGAYLCAPPTSAESWQQEREASAARMQRLRQLAP